MGMMMLNRNRKRLQPVIVACLLFVAVGCGRMQFRTGDDDPGGDEDQIEGISIKDEYCVAKSFPNFWSVFERLYS